MRPAALAAAVAIAALGCARGAGRDAAGTCEAVTYALDTAGLARNLAGRFAVTLVASTGDSSGRGVAGWLELKEAHRPDAVAAGAADLALEAIGALRLGRLDTSADSAPGVLGLPGAGARPTLLLRLGAEANAVGVTRFDGGYTVLEILRFTDGGFAGAWRSGVASDAATGHFCAQRLPEGRG